MGTLFDYTASDTVNRTRRCMADNLRYIHETITEAVLHIVDLETKEELMELRDCIDDLSYRTSQLALRIAIQNGDIQTISQTMEGCNESSM